MFNLVNTATDYIKDKIHFSIHSQLATFQEKGTTFFILEKLQERNPLQSSSGYKKQSKALTKRLTILKKIKSQMSSRLKKQDSLIVRNQLKNVGERITKLQILLHYLQIEETGQVILKLSTPCNFIIPGSGESLRMTGYCVKLAGATRYSIQACDRFSQVTQIAKEMTLAGSTTLISQFAYNKIRSLKESITYSDFRSLVYSYLQF